MKTKNFASDNWSGVCPEAMAAIQRANIGHSRAYGSDSWTAAACDRIREVFETDCDVYFVFNGTAANALALSALCRSYHSVLCHQLAHIETDECGAPTLLSGGIKLLTLEGEGGKLTPASIGNAVARRNDIHTHKIRAISLTQNTELGLVYRPDEIRALTLEAKAHGLLVHMDGSRFANAVASLDCHPADISWKAGVDVLCFGGTKNGLHMGDAILFFSKELAEEFDYRCKQAAQLASKMRFLSAAWLGYLEDGTWLRNARNANTMAKLLSAQLKNIPNLKVLHTVEANAVFVSMPTPMANALLAKDWAFYDFIGAGGYRLMCSWDTTREDINTFVQDVRSVAINNPAGSASQQASIFGL